MTKKIYCMLLSIALVLGTVFPAVSEAAVMVEDSKSKTVQSDFLGEFSTEQKKDIVKVNEDDLIFNPKTGNIEGINYDNNEYEDKYLEIAIPDKIDGKEVTGIEPLAFYDRKDIVAADFSNASSLTEIGNYAFAFSGLEEINLDKADNLESIKSYAFFGTPAEEIHLPQGDKLKKIEKAAFGNHIMTFSEVDEYLTSYESERPELETADALEDLDLNNEELKRALENELSDFEKEFEDDKKKAEVKEKKRLSDKKAKEEIIKNNQEVKMEKKSETDSKDMEIKKKKFLKELSVDDITAAPLGLRLMSVPVLMNAGDEEEEWTVSYNGPGSTSDFIISELAVNKQQDGNLRWLIRVQYIGRNDDGKYWTLGLTNSNLNVESVSSSFGSLTQRQGVFMESNITYYINGKGMYSGDTNTFTVITQDPGTDNVELGIMVRKANQNGEGTIGSAKIEGIITGTRPEPEPPEPPAPPEPEPADWYFTVMDYDTLQGIEGATVTIDGVGSAETDRSGIASINAIFENNKKYYISAEKDGYHLYSSQETFYSSVPDVEIYMEKLPSNRKFNMKVSGNDGLPVQGAQITLTDDSGNVLTGTSSADGKIEIIGNFTDEKSYNTEIQVPDGYFQPEETIKAVYNAKADNLDESKFYNITLDRTDVFPGDLFISTNVSDTDAVVKIYRGQTADESSFLKEAAVPAEGNVKIEGLSENAVYTVKIESVNNDKYAGNTGAETSFVYNYRKPNLKIYLNESSAENTFEIRVHEGGKLKPLTNKLEGKKISVKAKDGTEIEEAVISGGKAVFQNMSGIYEIVHIPSLKGYKIITAGNEIDMQSSGYQDWVLVKASSTVYLNAVAPVGESFPPDMKAAIQNSKGNIIGEVKNIGNGQVVFEDVPQGDSYNIIYSNVPENWTHSGNMMKSFRIGENEVATAVNDSFGYRNPDADVSEFAVWVSDNYNNPVDGYEFQLFSISDSSNPVATIITDSSGSAKTEVPKLAPGEYKVVNTKSKAGYSKVTFNNVIITEDKYNIKLDAVVGRDSGNNTNINLTLVNENGEKVPYEWLEFYENDALIQGSYQTDQDGKTYLNGLSYNSGSNYSVKLKDGSMYEFINGTSSSSISVEEGAENNITLEVKVKSEYGKINVRALTEEGKPARNVLIQIFREGSSEPVKLGYTDSNGNYISDYMPEGNYRVKILPPKRYEITGASEKNVQISPQNEGGIVSTSFTLKENYTLVENAGSILISGTMVNEKSDWSVTITKNASEDGVTKRGAINKIRFSEKELINPSNLKLIVEENGVQTERPINGHFTKVDGYYELVDDRTEESSSGEIKYIYTFKAQGIKNPPASPNLEDPSDTSLKSGYTVYASTKLMSDNPKEVIPKIEAAKKLMSVGHNVVMDAEGTGYTFRDFKQKWTYKIKAKSEVGYGDMVFTVNIPEGELQNEMGGTYLYPVNEDGTVDTAHPYSVDFNKSSDGKTVSFVLPNVGPKLKEYVFEINGSARTDQLPTGNYKQEASMKFVIEDTAIDENKFTAEAPGVPALPPVHKTVVTGCGPDRKFNIYMEGYLTNDKKNIQWIIKATNISQSNGTWPVDMVFRPGAGLGNIEGLAITSEGQMFPYITPDSFEGDELKNPVNIKVGQGVYDVYNSLNLDHSRMPSGLDISNMMKYMPYSLEGVKVYNGWLESHHIYSFMKTNVTGETSNLHSGDSIIGGSQILERPEVKVMKPGDFVEMSFNTPITDLAQVQQGYTMNFDFEMTGSGCGTAEESLTIQKENYQNRFKGCHLKTQSGDVKLTGKLNSTGDAVIWTAIVNNYKQGAINLNFDFTDEEGKNRSLRELGFKPYREHSTEGKLNGNAVNTDILEYTDGVGGVSPRYTMEVSSSDKGNVYEIKMTAPIDKDRSDITQYNLKVSGSIAGMNIGQCISKVEGLYTGMEIQKWWTNIIRGQNLPRAEFEILRYDELGGSEVLEEEADLKDPDNGYIIPPEGTIYAKKINSIDSLRRYDDNGNRYGYSIREKELKGYESFIYVHSREKNQFIAENRRINKFEQQQDPTEYTIKSEGQYPMDYRQDGPDIRNAYTHLDETELDLNKKPKDGDIGEPYKIDYPDAKIGKSGQQTDIPGEFDMNLTVEGKGSGYETGVDVVFVLDNSATMSTSMNEYVQGAPQDQLYYYNRGIANQEFRDRYETEIEKAVNRWADYKVYRDRYIYNNSKMVAMREYTEHAVDSLLSMNGSDNESRIRIGIVNYATDVDPIKADQESVELPDPYNRNMDYYYRKATAVNSQLMSFIYSMPYKELSNDKAAIQDAFPKAYRSNQGAGTGVGNDTGRDRLPSDVDGQTNIQAGVRKGMQLLYGGNGESNDGRKKVLVVLSDGAPSAHYDLRNGANIQDSSSTNILSTGKYHLSPNLYYTFNGVEITDHGIPALMEKDYWMEKYSTNAPEIITLSINLGQENDEATVEEQSDFLRNLSTGENGENAHSVKLPNQFYESMEAIEEKIISMNTKTITNGIVRDPMGEMVNIKDINGDGRVTLASSRELLDGDVYIEDIYGSHLNSSGQILDSENEPVTDGYTLLTGVGVRESFDKDGKMGFEVSGLNLGTYDEVSIHYKINLDTDNGGYYPETYYQANKTTTLEPRPGGEQQDEKIYRYFPIPSVKGPGEKIHLEKIWKDSNGNPMSDEELKTLENLGAVFKLERYKADRPFNSENYSEVQFIKDETYTPINLTLNQKNRFKVDIESLLAYDSTGHEYRYKFTEYELPDWILEGQVNKMNGKEISSYRFVYDKENGSQFIGETESILNPSQEGDLTVEFSNKQKEKFKPNAPNTGGRGTLIFTLFGLASIGLGFTLQITRNRRKLTR